MAKRAKKVGPVKCWAVYYANGNPYTVERRHPNAVAVKKYLQSEYNDAGKLFKGVQIVPGMFMPRAVARGRRGRG